MQNNRYKNTGNKGEALAADWLLQNQFIILEKNWRYKHTEVDIIATKHHTLHFVEVKTRTQKQFGLPEESITPQKMNALKKAAAAYLEANPRYSLLQIDVLAITLNTNNKHEYFFIEDVFF
jgi:putative endonuclease